MVATQETVNANISQSSNGVWQPSTIRLVCGGLVGSLIGLAIYKGIYPVFTIPFEVSNIPSPAPVASIEKLEAYQYRVDSQNYPIVFGLTGLIVGIACGFLASRNQAKGMILAGALGGALAAVGGLFAAMLVKTIRQTSASDIVLMGITFDGMMQSIIAQAAIWGLMGLGVGVGLGISNGGVTTAMKAALSGLLGGALASSAFIISSAFVFPASNSSHVIPLGFLEQVIMMALGGIGVGAAIGIGLQQRVTKGR